MIKDSKFHRLYETILHARIKIPNGETTKTKWSGKELIALIDDIDRTPCDPPQRS